MQKVLLRDMQRHPFKQQMLHLDFQRVDENEAIRIRVPLHFLNQEKSPAGKTSGVVISHDLNDVEISCLPKDLPEFIEVDLADVKLGDIVHLSELKLPTGVEIVALRLGEDHDTAVVTANTVKEEVEAAPARKARLPPHRPPRLPRSKSQRSAPGAGADRTRACSRFMAGLRLIVGLGNPGAEHLRTRHNAGFWFVDALAQGRASASVSTASCTARPQGPHRWHAVWLLKPTTYMNKSGIAVALGAALLEDRARKMLVAHDELDLPPGTAAPQVRRRPRRPERSARYLRASRSRQVSSPAARHRSSRAQDKVTPWVLWTAPP